MSGKQKKPIPLWVISILLMLTGAGSIISHVILTTNSISLPEPQQLYFESLTAKDHILAIIPKVIALLAGILLILGNKLGSPLILISLAANIFFMFYQANLVSPMSSFSYESIMPALMITLAIYLAAYLYTNTLVKRNVLK